MVLVHNVAHDHDMDSIIRKYLQRGVMIDGAFRKQKQEPYKKLVSIAS